MLDDLFAIGVLGADDAVATTGYELGVGRSVPTAAAALGLAAAIVGGLALARRRGPRRALAALALGGVAAIVGGLHAVNAAGGLGTGNGLAGAVIAVVLGLAGIVVGGLALRRSRTSAGPR